MLTQFVMMTSQMMTDESHEEDRQGDLYVMRQQPRQRWGNIKYFLESIE